MKTQMALKPTTLDKSSQNKELTIEQLAKFTGIEVEVARRIMKVLTLNLALHLSGGNSISLPYLGSFKKNGRFWNFEESKYLERIRNNRITEAEFISLILTEDDENRESVLDILGGK